MGHNLSAGHEPSITPGIVNLMTCQTTNFTDANFAASWEMNTPEGGYATTMSYSGRHKFRFYSTGGELRVPTSFLLRYLTQTHIDILYTPYSTGSHPDTLVFNCCTPTENNLLGIKYLIQRRLCTKKRTTETSQVVTICEGETYLGYHDSGQYAETYQNKNGCDSIHTVNLVIESLPEVSSISGQTDIVQNTPENYQVSHHFGSNYHWSITNGEILSGHNTNTVSVHWFAGPEGELCVTESNENKCQSQESCMSVSILNLQLFPNPTLHNLSIIWGGNQEEQFSFSIYSSDGRLIQNGIIVNGADIQMENLPSGIYFVEIFKEDLKVIRKITKM